MAFCPQSLTPQPVTLNLSCHSFGGGSKLLPKKKKMLLRKDNQWMQLTEGELDVNWVFVSKESAWFWGSEGEAEVVTWVHIEERSREATQTLLLSHKAHLLREGNEPTPVNLSGIPLREATDPSLSLKNWVILCKPLFKKRIYWNITQTKEWTSCKCAAQVIITKWTHMHNPNADPEREH